MTKAIPAALAEALAAGESETCEFRSSFGDEAVRTLCAFANTRGGALWLGVNDAGKVIGVELGKESLRDWANQIRQALGVNASLEPVAVDDKTVVRITVAESSLK
ncbi:MAG: ATP-binding protein, partial [Armatimonadota bacterium]|nr:ATP-binding protein [Armatimonadota bacterium]